MGQSLSLPVGVNKKGGARLVSGTDYLKLLIIAALSDGDSDNAFTTVGLTNDLVFQINNDATKAQIEQSIISLFDDLTVQELGALSTDPPGILFTRPVNEGDLAVTISFIDLESQQEGQVVINFSSSSTEIV